MTTVDYFEGVSQEDLFKADIKVEEKIHDTMPKYIRSFLETISIGFENHFNATMKESILKEKFNEMGMFCFVSWDWINPLSEWIGDRKCLEVMSGRGWLSKALRENGVDVIATDDFSWHKEERFTKWNNLVTPVEELDAVEAVTRYGKFIDVLIMTWAYMDDTAYRVIKELHRVNPKALVVVCGEGYGGCTADDNFFEHFEEVDDSVFESEVASNYNTWFGLHDGLSVGRYTETLNS